MSDNHSNGICRVRERSLVVGRRKLLLTLLLLLIPFRLLFAAELIDRVVAYVDDHAITYSEFRQKYAQMKQVVPNITEQEVANAMINNILLVEQARKIRLEAKSDDDLVKEYIDVRIKSRIYIKEEQLSAYYAEHKGEFGGKDYLSVRDEIENYLMELETSRQLKEHIAELRSQADIVIQLKY